MHLLTAQPGGYADDEGIIDLNQEPAELVILSSADSSLAALSFAYQALPDEFPLCRLGNWLQIQKPAAFDLYEHKVLQHAKVIVLSLLGGSAYWPYGVEQLVSLCRSKGIDLILVPGDDASDPVLLNQSTVKTEIAQTVWQYLRLGSPHNAVNLFNYLAYHFFGIEQPFELPQGLPDCFIYESQRIVVSLDQWKKDHDQALPVFILLFYKSHVQSQNRQMFDALIARIQEKAEAYLLPVALSSLKSSEVTIQVNALIKQAGARVILNATGFASHFTDQPQQAVSPTEYQALFPEHLPVIQLILSSSTEEDWLSQSIGLRSRDVAMQVVLPEMDGRIISVPVSFKAADYYDERCQIDVVTYKLQVERFDRVFQFALNWARLQQLPNDEKSIALVLANYPTQDGRIGNGVGLDTPKSTLNILQALSEAGYAMSDLPNEANELITQLQSGVTNSLETLNMKGCWQSLEVEDYLSYFKELPLENQSDVLEKWGTVEQDPKYRDGRLMIAGIRFNNVFVGIQPARGYNIDLNANYHDPDLVPPHSYLAFYFWLRHVFAVDAVIHVGKHGNLEWLPGKGIGLSATCWPDAILGPLPHFYPFIVNDPGEGSQAKRRTHAVIIDHLMPPMTRAEIYGDLIELETYVDEYYQALGVDENRLVWLKKAILDSVKKTHLINELPKEAKVSDKTLLEALDTYLCDIKEAQIRQGLHVLGELPTDKDKLIDTLVALVRLPRGEQPKEQGILHNLVNDLKLVKQSGELFNPLNASVSPWEGGKPDMLLGLTDKSWRTEADTRERLELLARSLLDDLLGAGNLPADLPHTKRLLQAIHSTLFPALQKSVDQELSMMIHGLNGGFIPPGPSGAPTRGRLDTLPTGKNFYSVDNRAIPSKAAWALGKKSAENVIMRYLQEQGDYPKQIGLSVWGTATMRTGGDDIAQAFALMGVEPIWAQGSTRVTDFRVIPQMQLGRPRVDIVLRVSGFFRDAFLNVIKLFDAAVDAIANYEEPGEGNVIRNNMLARQQALLDDGYSLEAAETEAKFRVFGSKPGAYGAGLQGLIDEKCWERTSDLAEAYLNFGGFAYSRKHEGGIPARKAFSHQLSQVELVMQNQDNREHDILDSDDYYQFQGGMTNAVNELSGSAPDVYMNDHSNPALPKTRTLKEEFNRVLRSRLLNPKWIEGMRDHGYKGAFEMAASVDYMFAYDATTSIVDDYQYEQVTDTLVFDPDNQAFLRDNNPEAFKEMGERLLEAIQRGMWDDQHGYADNLTDLINELEETLEI